ncbi:hypothetical protein HanXRQr2_Chr10g0459411 [Helianthus annuus]|uniref:Uncharacterized protein n=1 Tax=Helianthus annuus TaxID=4232 RepID=A0A9K3I0Y5_HELAN|nr:hypothetical protein HanXRQr2_Chr10g0459411 [Helianthus annuus]KAJ0600837.1 hypothetical protein HanIR_Chr03g0121611 [Helianthus annuus]KAJ0759647.1 hypothetical protein HanOQP8_Chr04g0129021 [Helianthus annuus]
MALYSSNLLVISLGSSFFEDGPLSFFSFLVCRLGGGGEGSSFMSGIVKPLEISTFGDPRA